MTSPLPQAALAVLMLAGLPWIRGSATRDADSPPPAAKISVPAASHVAVYAASAPEYRELKIPGTVRTEPKAAVRLVVFRNGQCILDRGLLDSRNEGNVGSNGSLVVQETGVIERAAAAPDGREAVVASTRFVGRVDMTPGVTSTANDFLRGVTTLTLVDPTHPDGRWQVTLEDGRWVRDLAVLSASSGIVVTSFVPRDGPADVRILDASGHEKLRVPDSRADTASIATSCDAGCFVAADLKFRDAGPLPERGVIVFDLAHGTSWTYTWRYGSDAEPLKWTLERGGVLAVQLPGATRRFGPDGRPL